MCVLAEVPNKRDSSVQLRWCIRQWYADFAPPTHFFKCTFVLIVQSSPSAANSDILPCSRAYHGKIFSVPLVVTSSYIIVCCFQKECTSMPSRVLSARCSWTQQIRLQLWSTLFSPSWRPHMVRKWQVLSVVAHAVHWKRELLSIYCILSVFIVVLYRALFPAYFFCVGRLLGQASCVCIDGKPVTTMVSEPFRVMRAAAQRDSEILTVGFKNGFWLDKTMTCLQWHSTKFIYLWLSILFQSYSCEDNCRAAFVTIDRCPRQLFSFDFEYDTFYPLHF